MVDSVYPALLKRFCMMLLASITAEQQPQWWLVACGLADRFLRHGHKAKDLLLEVHPTLPELEWEKASAILRGIKAGYAEPLEGDPLSPPDGLSLTALERLAWAWLRLRERRDEGLVMQLGKILGSPSDPATLPALKELATKLSPLQWASEGDRGAQVCLAVLALNGATISPDGRLMLHPQVKPAPAPVAARFSVRVLSVLGQTAKMIPRYLTGELYRVFTGAAMDFCGDNASKATVELCEKLTTDELNTRGKEAYDLIARLLLESGEGAIPSFEVACSAAFDEDVQAPAKTPEDLPSFTKPAAEPRPDLEPERLDLIEKVQGLSRAFRFEMFSDSQGWKVKVFPRWVRDPVQSRGGETFAGEDLGLVLISALAYCGKQATEARNAMEQALDVLAAWHR